MEEVKILIVEDEFLIAESLKMMLERLNYIVPAVFHSGTDLLREFKEGIADMILMDINLADDTNGIDTSRTLAQYSSIPIIYITQNREEKIRKQAIYETNAIYYLNKPFNLVDVCNAIDLTLKFLNRGVMVQRDVAAGPSYLLDDAIFIKEDFSYKKIRLADILYLKAEGSYCQIQCREKSYLFSENLSYFEERLDFAKDLIRIHRSYIINVKYLERIKESSVCLDIHEIPIGKTYKRQLLEKFRFI